MAPVFGQTMYIADATLVINLVVAVVLTPVFRAVRLPAGVGRTRSAR